MLRALFADLTGFAASNHPRHSHLAELRTSFALIDFPALFDW